MTQGFVDTRHGCIHYDDEGTGKPLILLHSNGASAHQYDDCMAGFAREWRVISWDMPGHGDSDPLTKHYSTMVDDPALFVNEVPRLLKQVAK